MVGACGPRTNGPGRLLSAQASAVALFDEVVARGIIAAGQGEQAVSDQIRDLANDMFGTTRHWHKRIVRSGSNTLSPYRHNPPDHLIEAPPRQGRAPVPLDPGNPPHRHRPLIRRLLRAAP